MELILCSSLEYLYFKEYIQTFLDGKTLILYDENTEKILNPDYICWCVRRIPLSKLNGQKINFINTEQLSVPLKFEEYQTYVSHATEIYDYSLENIRISGKGIYLPYREIPEETIKLKHFLNQEKKYDFAVIGSPSVHRNNQMQKIIQKGYTINYIHGWNDERDIEVGKCRNLLNIHFNSEYKLYEPIRCERWRFAGMPIYSEQCLDVPNGINIIDFDNFKLDK